MKKLSEIVTLPLKIDVSGCTQEEKKELQELLFKYGADWWRGKKAAIHLDFPYYFVEDCVITSSVLRETYDHHQYQTYTYKQLKEILMSNLTFTKADLKTGMVVKYRGFDSNIVAITFGGYRLVVGDYLIGSDCWNGLDSYQENLLNPNDKDFDIIEVLTANHCIGGLDCITSWELKSIWKRPEKSAEQIEIESIQAQMKGLNDRLEELKGKV